MLREEYFNYISSKLNSLAYNIETRGRLNLLGLHVHSEDFYLHFFNKLFDLNLENLNETKSNVEAIDLIDEEEKKIIQVSATATKSKINNALEKESLSEYDGFNFQFISISKDASNLRDKQFDSPDGLSFNPQKDIHDITSILAFIKSKDVNLIRKIYQFIKEELGEELNIKKLDSNLTHIINILAEDDLNKYSPKEEVNPFQIQRKIDKNELKTTQSLVRDYSKYHYKLDSKYEEFDKQGKNKSLSVLDKINGIYMRVVTNNENKSSDKIFLKILDEVREAVLTSKNFKNIPIDELDLCVNIITVDAFIRCKIFEDPKDYEYANT